MRKLVDPAEADHPLDPRPELGDADSDPRHRHFVADPDDHPHLGISGRLGDLRVNSGWLGAGNRALRLGELPGHSPHPGRWRQLEQRHPAADQLLRGGRQRHLRHPLRRHPGRLGLRRSALGHPRRGYHLVPDLPSRPERGKWHARHPGTGGLGRLRPGGLLRQQRVPDRHQPGGHQLVVGLRDHTRLRRRPCARGPAGAPRLVRLDRRERPGGGARRPLAEWRLGCVDAPLRHRGGAGDPGSLQPPGPDRGL